MFLKCVRRPQLLTNTFTEILKPSKKDLMTPRQIILIMNKLQINFYVDNCIFIVIENV